MKGGRSARASAQCCPSALPPLRCSLAAGVAASGPPVAAPAGMSLSGVAGSSQLSQGAVAPAPMPIVDMQTLLSNAGLELVDTDASKLAKARVETSQAPATGRVIRERKRLPPPEPLAQVETRKH